jgi:putative ABC transport system permease protein
VTGGGAAASRRSVLLEHALAAVGALRAHSLRSVLTVLGIVIAAAGVIAVVSIIQGFQRVVVDELQGLGSTYVVVMPDAPPVKPGAAPVTPRVTWDDGEALSRKVPGIARLVPVVGGAFQVKHADRVLATQVLGVGGAWQEVRNHYVERGRFFSELEVRRRRKVAVVGREVVERLGLGERPVGAAISVGGVPMTVIGVLEDKGPTLGQDPDELVVVPFRTALTLLGPSASERVQLHLQVERPELVGEVDEAITRELRRRHQIADGDGGDDFKVMLQDEVLDSVESVLTSATGVVAAVVGIALLVGGVGIMNIMLVSVTERTREIGLRKAVGARRQDILTQFLLEAALLSMAGGGAGIGLGYLLGYALSQLLPGSLPPAHVPLWVIGGALGFCAAIGIFFGLYPAARAAGLEPIEALRYE